MTAASGHDGGRTGLGGDRIGALESVVADEIEPERVLPEHILAEEGPGFRHHGRGGDEREKQGEER